MYQGTYARNPRKPRKRAVRMNKTAILLLAVILLAGAVIGTTVAYLTTNTDSITNTFEYAQVSCRVDERFNGTGKYDVKITNTGNIDAYIRAKVVINWRDAAGKIVTSVPSDYSYTIEGLPEDGNWVKNGDYYYYRNAVAKDASTGILLGSCTWTHPDNPQYFLSVDIVASAIQSQPTSAVTEAWGSDVPLDFNN